MDIYDDELTHGVIAEHLFAQIERMGHYDLPGLSVWTQASGQFCGDIVYSAPRPSGGVNILLANFIGRGLSAAVAALPVAEVFYGMTEKGFGLSDIIAEINNKLLFVLPENLFCAACFLELDQEGRMLAVWNGGLPDLIVLDSDKTIKHRVKADHAPLGVAEMDTVALTTEFFEVVAGDNVFCCSHGAINSKNEQGDTFGQDQIDALLLTGSDLAAIAAEITAYSFQSDDITLAELDIAAIQQYDTSIDNELPLAGLPPAQWQVDFNFSAQVLKSTDLVPLLMNVLMHLQAPHDHKQRIYTVLAEMFSNALEHGLLTLPSELKQSANGFSEYYSLRSQRLAELDNASIKISLQHEVMEAGGKLTIRVEDSGQGFDYQQHALDLAENKGFYGRGEALLRQLCSDYHFSGTGNTVQAVYVWFS